MALHGPLQSCYGEIKKKMMKTSLGLGELIFKVTVELNISNLSRCVCGGGASVFLEKASEWELKMPQSQTADQPTVS